MQPYINYSVLLLANVDFIHMHIQSVIRSENLMNKNGFILTRA